MPETPYIILPRVKAGEGQVEVPFELGLVFSDSQKFQLPAFTSDPGSPVAGQLWYNSTSGTVKARAGGVTVSLSGGGAGSGSVSSVSQTFTGGLISVAGSPVTDNGTLALTVAGTSGGIPYFSSASTWASSAALTSNSLILGGGAGNAPKVAAGIATDGTSRILLGANGASTGALKFFGSTSGNVLLRPNNAAGTDIDLLLPSASGTILSSGTTVTVAQGGTGLTSIGTALQVLRVNAAGTVLEYGSAPAAAAGTLTGTTLAANVVNSSLTTLGTLTALDVASTSTVNMVTDGADMNLNSSGILNFVGGTHFNIAAPILNFVGATSGVLAQFKDAAAIFEFTAANGMTLNGSQLLTVDGDGSALTGVTVATAGITDLAANVGTFLTTPSSANLRSAVTDETGTGALVFATSPTLVTPVLGTVAAGSILTNATGLPIATGVSGLGTGVATFLATPSVSNFHTTLSGSLLRDHFIGGGTAAANYGVVGALGWNDTYIGATGNSDYADATTGAWGVWRVSTSATSGQGTCLNLAYGTAFSLKQRIPPINALTGWKVVWRVKLNATTSETFQIGFCDSNFNSASDPNNGVFWQFDTADSDANFSAVTRSGGTETKTASGTAADTSWHDLEIGCTTSGTIYFKLDGGTAINISANVPTVALSPFCKVVTRTTAVRTADVDDFQLFIP